MDLELLRTFLEVNASRHFGQAAKDLHLTQAAVSARIKQLESTLGVRLFDRTTREIRLTPEGNRLVPYAEFMIAEWRKARQDVAIGGQERQIALGGSIRLWDIMLQRCLHQLHIELPELAIIAESHTPQELIRRLLDGILDVVFMLEPPQLEVIHINRFATISLGLYSSRPKASKDEAMRERYVMVDWGLAHALQHRQLFPDAPQPKFRMSDSRMALDFILTHGGAAFLPHEMVQARQKGKKLHLVSGSPRIERKAYAVYLINSAREGLIKKIVRIFEGAA